MIHTLKKSTALIKRDGLWYTIRRAIAWTVAHSPLAFRLSFPYYQHIRLYFSPSMLTYRVFANPRTRSGDIVALEQHVKPGHTIIDVGANAGTFSVVAAALTGETGRVLAFEPSPKFADIISRNITLNKLDSVMTVHQVALGALSGTVHLNETVADDTTNFVTDTGTPVPQATLDSFTKDFTHVDLLKIDAEGSELGILQGATETLAKTRVILFEICHKTLIRHNVTTQMVYDILTESFTLYHKNSKQPFVFDPTIEYNTDLIGYHK